jgi:hypothetical protein
VVGRGKEGEAWRGRILWGTPRLGAVPSPDQCPRDLGDGAHGLTVLALGRDRCGVPRECPRYGGLAHQLMRHGVRWVVVECGRTPCEEPQLSSGMIDDDDDDDDDATRGACSLWVSRHAEICEQEDWDDISHARVFVGDYRFDGVLCTGRRWIGRTPLIDADGLQTGCRKAPCGLPALSHRGQTGPGEGRMINSP